MAGLLVEHAGRFVEIARLSPGEIALACGMADQPHFSNVFRYMTGETPSRGRAEHRLAVAELPPRCKQVPQATFTDR